jgi:hypothetical protein
MPVDRRFLLIIGCAWIAAAAIVDPRGDFPLNDDWAYGFTVERLITERRAEPSTALWATLQSRVGPDAAGGAVVGLHLPRGTPLRPRTP